MKYAFRPKPFILNLRGTVFSQIAVHLGDGDRIQKRTLDDARLLTFGDGFSARRQ